ncbi:MAG: hypothetical protein LBV58_00435 [Acholeplasmatales bacterium]|jgi:primosomal protein DnaI|nr:hypothetical protein [Acholeplasmatales bacterium]
MPTSEEVLKIIRNDKEFKNINFPISKKFEIYDYIKRRDSGTLSEGGLTYKYILEPSFEIILEADENYVFGYSKNKKTLDINVFNSTISIYKCKIEDIHKDKVPIELFTFLYNFLSDYSSRLNKGIFVYGPHSSGKTYILSAIYNFLVEKKIDVSYISLPEFYRDSKFQTKDLSDYVDTLKKVTYLIIDDLGFADLDASFRDTVLIPLLKYRDINQKGVFVGSLSDVKNLAKEFIYPNDRSAEKSMILMKLLLNLTEKQKYNLEDKKKEEN